MEKLMDGQFFDRNSELGISRYLDGVGFDVSKGYKLDKVSGRLVNVIGFAKEAPKKEIKKEIKKEVKKGHGRRVKADRS